MEACKKKLYFISMVCFNILVKRSRNKPKI